jgi:hypothetical protein
MATQDSDNRMSARRQSDRHTAPAAGRTGRWGRLRPSRRWCLGMGGYLLAALLGALALYLWRARLPALVIPSRAEETPASPVTAGRAGSRASLEICQRQIKTRDLFKPSIPVPREDRLGQSTAQQLAERLQFVGTLGEGDSLAALVFIPNRGPGTFRVGDRVAEFVLKSVKPDRVTLTLGDEEATLKR